MDNVRDIIAEVYMTTDDCEDLHMKFATKLGVSRNEAKTILYRTLYSYPFFRSLGGK